MRIDVSKVVSACILFWSTLLPPLALLGASSLDVHPAIHVLSKNRGTFLFKFGPHGTVCHTQIPQQFTHLHGSREPLLGEYDQVEDVATDTHQAHQGQHYMQPVYMVHGGGDGVEGAVTFGCNVLSAVGITHRYRAYRVCGERHGVR